ncbi:hypothetical protein MHBO_001041 [Bonamia ostreae]|uniref:TFA2 Winged helix domain-containing protein n=1 Tax=Bonamia ostreae TaxID=126728 RepID=A0ABV2AIH9_9EUKA
MDTNKTKKPHIRFVIKSAIEFLKEKRKKSTLTEIFSETVFLGKKIKIESEKEMEKYSLNLRANTNVGSEINFNDEEIFFYKPKLVGIKDKEDLINYLRNNVNGILESNFEDCYPNVKKDIEILKKNNKITTFPSTTGDLIIFKIPDFCSNLIKNDKISVLWNSVKFSNVSQNDNLKMMKTELRQKGHQIFEKKDIKKNRNTIKKNKPKKRWNRINLTNKHLKGKFEIYKKLGKD